MSNKRNLTFYERHGVANWISENASDLETADRDDQTMLAHAAFPDIVEKLPVHMLRSIADAFPETNGKLFRDIIGRKIRSRVPREDHDELAGEVEALTSVVGEIEARVAACESAREDVNNEVGAFMTEIIAKQKKVTETLGKVMDHERRIDAMEKQYNAMLKRTDVGKATQLLGGGLGSRRA